jgi:hypothetical protein
MLNIAKQIYSGWNTTGAVHDLPEAEVIPFGTSSNEKKRLESITKRYAILKEHDNIPLPGFTLYKNGRKNYSSADSTWLIIDPRGYLVRITNKNLEDILHVTGITEGLIQQKCVWAREDSQTKMILVPTSSPLYIEASDNTELMDSRVSIKDVQIGDEVLLQNKVTGTYMGVLSLYGPIDPYDVNKKPQVFLRRQIVKVSEGKYHYQTDLKILKVTGKTKNPITREESVALINADLLKGNAYFSNAPLMTSSGYYSTRGMIKHVSVHAVPKLTMTFEEITRDEATSLFYNAALMSDKGMLVVEQANNQKYLIDYPYYSTKVTPANIHAFAANKIHNLDAAADCIKYVETDSNFNNYYRSTKTKTNEVHDLDNFVKFYKIVKHVKKESYV